MNELQKYGTSLIAYVTKTAEAAARDEVKKQLWLIAGVVGVAGIAAILLTRRR